MEMEMESLVKGLIGEFYEKNKKIMDEWLESVYERYYASVADSFKNIIEEHCKVVIFSEEYSMSVQELHNFDRCAAIEMWHDHVDRSLEDFHYWAANIQDAIDTFISWFQKWLSERDDERTSNAIVAFMGDDIDLTKIIMNWVCYHLGFECWDYPD